MHRFPSLTTSDLASVTGGASPSEALAGAYTPPSDMRQPNTVDSLRRLPGALATAVGAAMNGSVKGALAAAGGGLWDVATGQLKDAFNGQGAPIVAPGL